MSAKESSPQLSRSRAVPASPSASPFTRATPIILGPLGPTEAKQIDAGDDGGDAPYMRLSGGELDAEEEVVRERFVIVV